MRHVLLVAALVLAVGCADAPLPDYPPAGGVVSGNIITCPRASDVSEYKSGTYHSYSCIWYCASYKGEVARYVDLTYVWSGSTWLLSNEYVSNGICN